MSGFEVAGVVLGAVPILVSALQLYIQGASTLQKWRLYTRELKSLTRSLETEQAKLQNICERLLVNIVPETKIEDMINDPFGPLWRDEATSRKIHERLWRSAKVFKENVLDMNEAIEEIKAKLDLGPDGKPRWLGSSSVKKELKRVLFVLQRSDYQELIARLRNGVSSLESLISSTVGLEHSRGRRSRGRVCKVVRNTAIGVYHAVRGAVNCACPSLHDVGLRLTPQPVTITPDDDDEDIIKSLEFRIAVSYASTAMETNGQQWGSVRLWNQVLLRPVKVEKQLLPQTTTTTTTSPHSRTESPRPRKRVKFSFASSAATVTTASTTSVTTTTTAPDVMEMQWTPTLTTSLRLPSSISNLCQTLRRSQKQGAGECCGRIMDQTSLLSRTFDVYPLGSPDNEDCTPWSMVPLGAVLGPADKANTSHNGKPYTPLSYIDRLRLAWTVASSVVHLQSTPWLNYPPTHNDIFLTQQDDGMLRQDAFVLRPFPDRSGQAGCGRIVNPATGAGTKPALLALGVLLIELIIGQPIESLCPPGSTAGLLDDYQTIAKLLDRVNTMGGANYHSAVRTCIRQDFYLGEAGKDEDGITQQNAAFFDVIGHLERDMEIVAGM